MPPVPGMDFDVRYGFEGEGPAGRSSALNRQRHLSAKTPAGPVRQRDPAVVRLHDRLRDREPEADASGIAAARRLQAVERLEHPGEVLLRNSGSLIVNGDFDRCWLLVDGDLRLLSVFD